VWIFQSTRPCGTRPLKESKVLDFKNFNPRAPVGRDLLSSDKYKGMSIISIHAPLWDATCIDEFGTLSSRLFQSTRPCGTRLNYLLICIFSITFQSTRPCGTRQNILNRATKLLIHFNPRAPVGRDHICWTQEKAIYIFQSTRPCGTRH